MHRRVFTTVLSILGILALVSILGCPLGFENEPRPNTPPTTYFLGDPPDTTFRNEIFFSWAGSDLDTDVVAYQFQLVRTDAEFFFSGGASGSLLEAIDPREGAPGTNWSGRQTDAFHTFSDLDDGFYDLGIRAIDAKEVADDTPARKRFVVFFDDISPEVVILSPTVRRLNGRTSEVFVFDASDQSRNDTTPRSLLEFSYQLRALSLTNCDSHLNDAFTPWRKFPTGTDPVTVGDAAPTQYSDLFSLNCVWMFTLRVRDPAGNLATETFELEQNGSGL